MAFPDEELTDGERLLVREHPHPKLLLVPAVVFVLVCGVGGYLSALLRRETWRGFGWSVVVVIAGVVVLWFAVAPLLRWFTTHFVVTDRRVLVREGVVRRAGFEIPMSRIDSVYFRQGLFERMLGCGTLTIDSVSGSDAGRVEFEKIPHVEYVRSVLNDWTGQYG